MTPNERFPVEWKGLSLSLSYLTVAVKERFCDWLYGYLTDQACKRLAGRQALTAYLDSLFADKPWWGAGRLSHHVQTALAGQDGGTMYTRLLLGDSAKALSDADIQQFIEDKEREQAEANERAAADSTAPVLNDYTRAMNAITEHEFPKVVAGSASGLTPGAGTNTTGTC